MGGLSKPDPDEMLLFMQKFSEWEKENPEKTAVLRQKVVELTRPAFRNWELINK